MKVALVTLSNELYRESRERLVSSATCYGVTGTHAYDFDDIKSRAFYQANRHIFDGPRGMGYWLWKPLIIAETLQQMTDGDVVVYMDAGMEVISDLSPLVQLCHTTMPVVLFGNGTDSNVRWTKRDTFVLMGCDEPVYWYGPHCDASMCLFRKCQATMEFVAEWQRYASNENILTDLPNISGPNLEAYQDHRHDQSVLSLLAQQHRIPLYRSPSQFGNHYKMYDFRVAGEFNCTSQWDQQLVAYYSTLPYYNSFYGQLVNHHRSKTSLPIASGAELVTPPRYSATQRFYRRVRNKLSSILQVS
jgi:hypothetical protein